MTNYSVEFYSKTKDERGKTVISWSGTVEVSMMPHEQMPVVTKAFRQAPERCQNAFRVVVTRTS